MTRYRMRFLLGVLLLSGGLVGCRRQATEETSVTPEQVVQEETNRFLNEQGIALPEGAERAYLSGIGGSRGVATREMNEGAQTYTIVADLPVPETGAYYGWLVNNEGGSQFLGEMMAQKGGYVVEKTTRDDWSLYNKVVISQDMSKPEKPGTPVIEGSF